MCVYMTSDVKIKILLGFLVQVVLYGCETLVPRKTKELKMKTYEKIILRRSFDQYRDSQSSDWNNAV